MNLRMQRRMACSLLKCGLERVWLDPAAMEEISEAVTRGDVRSLISSKLIRKKQKKGVSTARAKHRVEQKRKGRRKGQGKRKGAKGARTPKKEHWMKTIRALRSQLRELKTETKIDSTIYRRYYRKANGGMFKSRAHLMAHMKAEGAFEVKKEAPQVRFGAPVKKVVRKVVRRKKVVTGVE